MRGIYSCRRERVFAKVDVHLGYGVACRLTSVKVDRCGVAEGEQRALQYGILGWNKELG